MSAAGKRQLLTKGPHNPHGGQAVLPTQGPLGSEPQLNLLLLEIPQDLPDFQDFSSWSTYSDFESSWQPSASSESAETGFCISNFLSSITYFSLAG